MTLVVSGSKETSFAAPQRITSSTDSDTAVASRRGVLMTDTALGWDGGLAVDKKGTYGGHTTSKARHQRGREHRVR